MRKQSFGITGAVLLIAFLGSTLALSAGDLDPPPGPITPTMKTLDQVEPRIPIVAEDAGPGRLGPLFTIIAPGSYMLMGNMTQTKAASPGIVINASDVTVDLNGFELSGTGVGTDGIVVQGAQTNIAIFNGNVADWTANGVDASTAAHVQLRDLRVSDFGSGLAGGDGLRTGSFCEVVRCVVTNTGFGGDGIEVGGGALVSQCVSGNNGDAGIRALGFGCRVEYCNVLGNRDGGIVAIEGSTIKDCTVTAILDLGFGIAGIDVGNSCHVVGNTLATASFLAGPAIRASGTGNRVESNQVYLTPGVAVTGIDITGTGNLILRNSVSGIGTHYSIAPGNSYGPIINVAGMGDISLNPGTQHPWTNFSY